MERRLCVADYEKDKTQQRAKRSIDMMICAKCALFSSNYKLIARAARPLKKQRWGSHELNDPALNSPEMQPFYSKIQGNVLKSCRKSLQIRSLSGRQSVQVNNLLLMGFSVSFFSFSFWGKFSERQKKPQTHFIQSTHQLYSILNDPSYHISAIRICSEDVMEVVTT